jgi:hypothetical protein
VLSCRVSNGTWHQFGAGGGEGVEIIRVVETEGTVPGDADAHRGGSDAAGGGGILAGRQGWRGGSLQQDAEVDVLLDRSGQLRDPGVGGFGLVGRHQSEVTLVDGQAVVAWQCTQHLDVGVVLDYRAQLRFVAASADEIENHSGESQARVELAVAEQQRGDAADGAPGIEDHDHRQVEQVTECRVAVAALDVETIVQSLVALDQHHVGTRAVTRELHADLGRGLHLEIKVVTWPFGRSAEPHRVDVVRTLLERLHGQPTAGKGGAQADADAGLARGLVRGGDQESGHGSAAGRLASSVAQSAAVSGRASGRNGSTRTPSATSNRASAPPPIPSAISGSDGA